MHAFSLNFVNSSEITDDVDMLWTNFSNELERSIMKYNPHRTTSAKNRPPWISREIKRLFRKREKLHRKFKKSANPMKEKEKIKKLKQTKQSACRKAYWSYVENLITESKKEPQQSNTFEVSKRFWSFIKHKKTDSSAVQSLNVSGNMVTDPKAKSNALNDQFQSVFSNQRPMSLKMICDDYLAKNSRGDGNLIMPDFDVSTTGVKNLLDKLKPHKAGGPDQLRPRVLKEELSCQIFPALTHIFNASLEQGKIPKIWKSANIVPIFKKGDRAEAVSYRPISLTCVCCKLLEHVICSQLMKHLNSHGILYNSQHGFREKRSCETQLLEFSHEMLLSMQNGNLNDLIIMDFSKAFDKVAHNRLLYKLNKCGIKGKTLRWIQAFLSGKSQSLVLNSSKSKSIPVLSGVPQGSVLGPALFLVYINDLPQYVRHSTVRLFADDTLLYVTIANERDCQKMQEDLHNLEQFGE